MAGEEAPLYLRELPLLEPDGAGARIRFEGLQGLHEALARDQGALGDPGGEVGVAGLLEQAGHCEELLLLLLVPPRLSFQDAVGLAFDKVLQVLALFRDFLQEARVLFDLLPQIRRHLLILLNFIRKLSLILVEV